MLGRLGVDVDGSVTAVGVEQPMRATDVHSARTPDFTRSRYRKMRMILIFICWLSEEGVELLGQGLHRDFTAHAFGNLAVCAD